MRNRVDASSVVRAADPTKPVGAEAVKLLEHSDPLVAGSNPAGGANNYAYELSTQIGEILSFGFWMEKEGYRPATVRSAIEALKSVARHVESSV